MTDYLCVGSDSLSTNKKENVVPIVKQAEVANIVIRQQNAKARFIAAAMELGKVDKQVAEHAMLAFLKAKVIHPDNCGQMIVKNAQVYDHDVLVAWAAEAKFMELV